jgi:hypothetical protein
VSSFLFRLVSLLTARSLLFRAHLHHDLFTLPEPAPFNLSMISSAGRRPPLRLSTPHVFSTDAPRPIKPSSPSARSTAHHASMPSRRSNVANMCRYTTRKGNLDKVLLGIEDELFGRPNSGSPGSPVRSRRPMASTPWPIPSRPRAPRFTYFAQLRAIGSGQRNPLQPPIMDLDAGTIATRVSLRLQAIYTMARTFCFLGL